MQIVAGKVVVRAPLRIKESYIDNLLINKSAWIQDKLTQQLRQKIDQNRLCTGGQIWFDGKLCPLNVTYGLKNTVNFDGSCINIVIKTMQKVLNQSSNDHGVNANIPEKLIKKKLEVWLKSQAEHYLIPRCHQYSQVMLLTPNTITIRQYKARWGSCNSLGNVQFNYLLMMAPKWVVDYVIVHELCHLQHLNHSREFWQLVEQYSPDYILAKKWLKKHQQKLLWSL
ncbi:hypothetical protein GCM10011501_25220 [Thalassotalea profundi]|uniref:YgjP-like metallopeptidase domain-containing protein n=1 Tax=Thalassotalea profundi TaxID=2036687 RepID=A0ABQ3IXX6_9GAMM|nr:hypothetical protein GCM10011501_25220 [Thalassotalea profundi]